MIPIRTSVVVDEVPAAVLGLIIANVAVFVLQSGLPGELVEAFILHNALVPARYTRPDFAREMGLDPGNVLPLVTNTFMHAGWLHLIVNMWTLWLFGRPLEERLGAPRFVVFYLLCGALASAVHFAFNFNSEVPALGASGAVAGVLGGYTLFYPRARVMFLTPVLFFPVAIPVPAIVYTGIWFAIQLAQGVAGLADPVEAGGIAWWAHVGGFLAGLAAVKLVGAPGRPARRVGGQRESVREFGVPRVGVVRVGPHRGPIEMAFPARRGGPAPAELRGAPRPASQAPAARTTVIDRPQPRMPTTGRLRGA